MYAISGNAADESRCVAQGVVTNIVYCAAKLLFARTLLSSGRRYSSLKPTTSAPGSTPRPACCAVLSWVLCRFQQTEDVARGTASKWQARLQAKISWKQFGHVTTCRHVVRHARHQQPLAACRACSPVPAAARPTAVASFHSRSLLQLFKCDMRHAICATYATCCRDLPQECCRRFTLVMHS